MCGPIKSQWKPLKIICFVFFNWLLMWFPLLLAFQAIVVAKRVVKFIFSGHVSSDVAVKQDLMNSPLVNCFLCLANKWATWKLTHFHFIFYFLWRYYAMLRYSILNFLNFWPLFFCEWGILWWVFSLVMVYIVFF